MKSKKLIVIFSLVLVVALGVTAFIVLKPDNGMNNFKEYTFAGKTQDAAPYSPGFTKCFDIGEYSLWLNPQNSALSLVSRAGKSVFDSASSVAADNMLAAFLNVTLRDEAGNSYELNSIHNGVLVGGFSVEEQSKNNIKLLFSLFKDKNAYTQRSGISAVIPVELYPVNEGFGVSIDMSAVQCPEGVCVEKISILPGFFSVENASSKDMYIIPDGCGARVGLGNFIEKSFNLELPVYGSDVTFKEYTPGANLPAFAYKNVYCMLTSIITGGDALSTITLNRFSESGGNLYNTFTVTPFGNVDGVYVKGESYSGKISQTFTVTGAGKSDYNQFASLVREYLIKKEYLPASTGDVFTDYPFFVNAPASVDGSKDNVYTTFENGSEMIALLKSRGVRSVALRLSGIGKEGLNTGANSNDTIGKYVGDKEEYKTLLQNAKKNNGTVWLDADFATDTSSQKTSGIDKYPDLRKYLSEYSVESEVVSYKNVYKNISSMYEFLKETEDGNICVNDLSFLLYTDVKGGVNRQEALDSLNDKLSSLSIGGGLMLTKPAVYLMKNVQAVSEMPQSALCEGNPYVESVPILQLVLHGSVYYGTQPVNLNVDGAYCILKAVETGAIPSFVFTHSSNEVLNYGPYTAQLSKYYSTVKKMLPLTDMEITSHEVVVSGVYKVTYDYNKVVYINYNPSVVEVNGVLVSAKDFIVI